MRFFFDFSCTFPDQNANTLIHRAQNLICVLAVLPMKTQDRDINDEKGILDKKSGDEMSGNETRLEAESVQWTSSAIPFPLLPAFNIILIFVRL